MKEILHYINQTLGTSCTSSLIEKDELDKLPMFINEAYKLYSMPLFNKDFLLIELKNEEAFSTQQLEKHGDLIKKVFHKKIIFMLPNLAAYNRKRLIEKGINFIVPDKQLFLPELLIDLRESDFKPRAKQKNDKLLPSAQFLVIYHILHRYNDWKIENHSFKEIAKKLHYTAMAITNAIESLKYHEVVTVEGEKEKYIKFKLDRHELWGYLTEYNLLINPVLKTVYVDELPKDTYMLHTNASALPEYTNLNPSKQKYYAIEKTIFYGLQKNNTLVNINDYEGNYALEVWKYNPYTLVEEMANDLSVVDPLSLYLSLKDNQDERIEMALEQIIENFIW
jgi:hypothetical protein